MEYVGEPAARAEDKTRSIFRFRPEFIDRLLDCIGAVVVVLDTRGQILWVNEAFERLTGYSLLELSGRYIWDGLLSEDEAPRVRKVFNQLRAGDFPNENENSIIGKDGSRRHIAWSNTALTSPGGSVEYVIGTGVDVTERRRMEAELRAREERFRRVLDALPVGVWITDAQGDIVVGNPAGRRIWGGARYVGIEEYSEYKGWWVDTGEPIAAHEWALARAVTKGETSLGELVRIACFDGTRKVILNSSVPLRDERGEIIGAIVINEDVTEKWKAEEDRKRLVAALEGERKWLQAVIDYSPMGIFLIENPSGRTTANRRAEELFGMPLPPEQEASQYLGRICRPDGTPLAEDELPGLRARLHGEVITAQELLLKRAEGSPLPVLLSSAPIVDDGGQRLGSVVICEDISVLKELERLREEWTSVVAHDLRQPVNAISLLAGSLARSPGELQGVKRKAEHILASVRSLDRLITDLLDVSRISARRLVLEKKPAELRELIAAIIERNGEALQGRSVRFDRRGEPLWAEVDPGRFEQILGNLLSNAAKYGFSGTEIELSLSRRRSDVVISVLNRGPGIAPDELPMLFRRFHRAKQVRGGEIAGVGLGLYISRGLVEAHGGRLWVESTPGEVTAFRFTLPLPLA